MLAAVEGDVPHHGQGVGEQGRGTVGGNGLPDLQIGVVDTFLGVLMVVKHVLGDAQARVSVFGLELKKPFLGARKQQINDILVAEGRAGDGGGHGDHSFRVNLSFTYDDRFSGAFLRKILDLSKIFLFVPIIAYFTVAKNTPSARFFGAQKRTAAKRLLSGCSAIHSSSLGSSKKVTVPF